MYLPTTFKRVSCLPTTCKGESAVYPPPACPARESQLFTHHQEGVSYLPTTCKRESAIYPPPESAIYPPPIYPPQPASPAKESQLCNHHLPERLSFSPTTRYLPATCEYLPTT